MATALQCPACGFKHRLDAVADTPVFPCSRCDRQLKLPAQFRNGSAARPGEAPNARPTVRRTAGGRGSPSSAAAGSAAPRKSRASVRSTGTTRLPLKILAWVIAFVLGAGVVRVLASWTGFVDTNTFLDLMLEHSFSTYWRLLVIIPIWAFFATAFATAFIEAPDWWARRSLPVAPKPAISRRVPAGVPLRGDPAAKSVRPGDPSPSTRPAAAAPRRVPPRPQTAAQPRSPRTVEPRTRDAVPPVRARTPESAPAPDQRPRRIPRRDTAS